MAITWAAVFRSFAVTRPMLHLRFARLNLRVTSTRSHSSSSESCLWFHPSEAALELCRKDEKISPRFNEPGRNFIRGLDLVFRKNNGRHIRACHYQCGSVFLPSVAYFMERARNAAICARVQVALGSKRPPPTPVVMPFSTAQATACA